MIKKNRGNSGMSHYGAKPLFSTRKFCPKGGHPYMEIKTSLSGRWQKQHRYIMEVFLKRKLKKSEIIHHKDGDSFNNRLENLEILSRGEHTVLHNATRTKEFYKKFSYKCGRKLGDKWSWAFDCCSDCGSTTRKHKGRGYCYLCYKRRLRAAPVCY